MPTHSTAPTADGTKSLAQERISSRRRWGWDVEIAEIALRQRGLVTLAQLRALGLGESTIYGRLGTGRLHQVHDRVFAVGHTALTIEARLLAAVLACGADAVLSHRSAAKLWNIRADRCEEIDVTAPRRRGRSPDGIAAHRDGMLRTRDCTVVKGIPCTTVERTLLDLAAVLPIYELRKALAEAEVMRLVDLVTLRRLIRRCRGRRGVARLRMLIDEIHPETKRTRSELERLFLRMCDRAGLPRPEVNVSLRVGTRTYKPDFLWRDEGLIVEADSMRFHDTHSAFQQDRRREQNLQAAGWRVSRCTWEQVEREPRDIAITIRALLSQANPRRRD